MLNRQTALHTGMADDMNHPTIQGGAQPLPVPDTGQPTSPEEAWLNVITGVILRYSMAIGIELIAWRVTLVAWPWIKPNVGPLFFVAMIVTAWFGGIGPALVSTVVAMLCMAYLIPNPLQPPGFYSGDIARFLTFLMTSVMITWLNKARKQAQLSLAESWRLQGHLQEQRQRLETTNERLRQEIAERQRAQDETLSHQETLRKLAAELSITEERERRQIASQLHDGVGQMLAFTQMKLESARTAIAEMENSPRAVPLDEALGQLKEAIAQTRMLTRELSPPVLYEAGLENAMEWLADTIRRQHGLPVSIDRHGTEAAEITRELRIFLFQTVRELLTNVVKHAKAKQANVTLFLHNPRSIRVVVEDDGRGAIPDLASLRDGFGLLNIRERIKHLGGQIEVENDPGRGARVIVTVPAEAGLLRGDNRAV
ncbi:MAG TPA: sensor histidine kinase [Tepidisphaeraceae bacterium]|jgi:signal transduction histidine kinase|nr:sensor histidine kinase [Tepidisphaeraceae bacterium]